MPCPQTSVTAVLCMKVHFCTFTIHSVCKSVTWRISLVKCSTLDWVHEFCDYVYSMLYALSPPQNLLFNPQQGLFLHQSSSTLALIPTFTDLGMMVTCLVAQFRCNYRNSHIFSVCLNPSSPPIFRLAFIRSIHTLLEQVIRSNDMANKLQSSDNCSTGHTCSV